ncbi:hypothetical protein [Mycolicibacterium brisbanense]|uniref:Uncharacterized protein n=1 Tax=Mycolicibacterium brisbanense TaxID=146020 RepID=A0A100VZ34_9MYCO|nr:hypothetical protein [Mycolicibacterium brisbanense]MCV7158815.1 hypothetical protein [Mycolicibacterium brisbanense]GAS88666.1 uncharacterized protein RMCB_2762 [Mycolicibacterium brisbanense]
MDDTALLTDDEIVALCAADGRPWPIGLSTVAATPEELARAGMRGMRSLMVRRLARADADRPGMRPHEMIADDLAAFLDSEHRVGAYIAPASDHSVLGGASVTAAQTPDGWVVDTTTAAGVHALRPASAEDAAAAVLGLAEHTYDGTAFTEEDERAAWVCVIRDGSDLIAIGHGSVSGTVDGKPTDRWDPAAIRALFGAL